MRRYVSCPKCAHRNDRTGGRRKCEQCGAQLPKRRVPKHAEILDDGYEPFVRANEEIHGVSDESCGVCGKPRPQDSRWDRDHGHRKGQPDYGKARGLACSGNQGCNVLMVPWVTAATARGIYEAKMDAGELDADRWLLIARYLERVESFYASERMSA